MMFVIGNLCIDRFKTEYLFKTVIYISTSGDSKQCYQEECMSKLACIKYYEGRGKTHSGVFESCYNLKDGYGKPLVNII